MISLRSSEYIPDRGDIVWLNFDPTKGREQAGHRPAFIVSPASFNRASNLAFLCPITKQVKGFSFEVPFTSITGKITGAVLVHHLRSIDWKVRKVSFADKASEDVIFEVLAKLETIVS